MTIAVTSASFRDGDTIPQTYTCDGADSSPPLRFGNVPPGTAELALFVEDPDAPGGTFVHWLAWGLNPAQPELAEGHPAPIEGKNGFGSRGYRGPCPPKGTPHRYVFTVYALDQRLSLPAGADVQDLRKAVHGHALAEGSLTGRYGR
jgi:Raf kinase inhibitor-like YbhB/YbcL family protein